MLRRRPIRQPCTSRWGCTAIPCGSPPDADWLVIAGQVGVNAKGRLAGGVRQQAEQAFRNIVACLRANKMKKEHLVKLTRNLFDRREVAAGEFGYTTVLNAGTLAYPLVPGSKAMKHGVVTAALVLCVAWSAQADLDIGTYHALIIGNNDYPYRCIPYSPAVGSMAERRHRRCLLLIPQAERGGTLKSPASQGEAVAALRDGTLTTSRTARSASVSTYTPDKDSRRRMRHGTGKRP